MKTKLIIPVVFGIIIIIIVPIIGYKYFFNTKEITTQQEDNIYIEEMNQDLEKIKIDKAGLLISKKYNENLSIEDVTHGSATEKMISLQKEIEKTQNEIDELEDGLFVSENELNEYNTAILKNKDSKKKQQKILSQYAVDIFESEKPFIKTISFLKESSLKNMIFRYNNINEYFTLLNTTISKAENSNTELEKNKGELTIKQNLYNDSLTTLNIKKEDLLSKQSSLKRFLIQEQIVLFNESIMSSSLLKNRIIKSKFRYEGNSGSHMILPVSGSITSEYGDRVHPLFGTEKHHAGVDIGVEEGTPVLAAADGVVEMASWYGGYGKAIMIDHGNNISSLYGHNSQLLVKEGSFVKQGQVIALAGSTGYSTGPHCHFEVRVNGDDVDPFTFI